MITYGELFALGVFACMAGYIMYLQHLLKKAEHKRYFLEMVIVDVLEGNVTIRKTEDGFTVNKTKRMVDGEA